MTARADPRLWSYALLQSQSTNVLCIIIIIIKRED